MKGSVDILWQPDLENASLIVAWQEDAGNLGTKVIDYLNNYIKARTFAGIEPEQFFPLNGLVVENNLPQFPSSQFFAGERNDLVIFKSSQPVYQKHAFLNNLLDTGEYFCKIKEIYAISGIVSSIAHTSPRRLMAAYSQPEFQRRLQDYDVTDLTWQGQPAINSFLLWLAQKRNIPAVSLWPEISFYFTANADLAAVKTVASFFNKRFDLGLDFSKLDSDIKAQNESLSLLQKEDPEVDKYIRTLEVGISLTEEEQLRLAQKVTDFLQKPLL